MLIVLSFVVSCKKTTTTNPSTAHKTCVLSGITDTGRYGRVLLQYSIYYDSNKRVSEIRCNDKINFNGNHRRKFVYSGDMMVVVQTDTFGNVQGINDTMIIDSNMRILQERWHNPSLVYQYNYYYDSLQQFLFYVQHDPIGALDTIFANGENGDFTGYKGSSMSPNEYDVNKAPITGDYFDIMSLLYSGSSQVIKNRHLVTFVGAGGTFGVTSLNCLYEYDGDGKIIRCRLNQPFIFVEEYRYQYDCH